MEKLLPHINERSLYDTSQIMRQKKLYQPKFCKVYTWDSIEKTFDTCFAMQYSNNIAELIRHIKSTGLSNRLFGVTSMDKLIVGIYDPIEWDRETLHITFNYDSDEWSFVYYSLPNQRPRFVRKYPFEKGIEKFDNFIKMIGW